MPVTKFSTPEKYRYQNGFGSYHEYASLDSIMARFGDTDLDAGQKQLKVHCQSAKTHLRNRP